MHALLFLDSDLVDITKVEFFVDAAGLSGLEPVHKANGNMVLFSVLPTSSR